MANDNITGVLCAVEAFLYCVVTAHNIDRAIITLHNNVLFLQINDLSYATSLKAIEHTWEKGGENLNEMVELIRTLARDKNNERDKDNSDGQ